MRDHFFELECKKDGRKADRKKICNGFGHIHRHSLVGGEERWHDINERDQQNKLTHHRHKDGSLCLSQRGECHLAGHLNTEQKQASHIDAQRSFCILHQGCVRSKHGGKRLWEEHYKEPEQYRIAEAGFQ